MILLDLLTFGFLALAITQAKDPQKSAGEITRSAMMGILGAVSGAYAASVLLDTRIFFTLEHVLVAMFALTSFVFLGKVATFFRLGKLGEKGGEA